ncbi:polysaccharide deacetylase family protein [Actinocorallia sp. A-T 12471]|uniref:polysaccharide deacetylase family protein n=1 Tax=Actinocorallia sp. A-T 12471 TaxID=3089813 RepID=UPI0029CF5C68|nr:polysaccharide deacetylase family protein [Actinocorallia sp. A-T 12471]MDX6738868.1 glycosyltransferase [Actinocorallia sp. A-T 12471]
MKHREPRAHWFLIGLGSFLLALLLLFDGFVQGVVGETKDTEAAGGGMLGPAEVTQGGPVVNTGQGTTQSARMPDKTIALTFDDGPDPEWTPQILDVLAQYDAKASFFMIGGHVSEHPDLARRVLAEGHEIGNHTYSHVDLASSPEWRIKLELSLTQRALAGALGVKTRLMRMPYSGSAGGATEGQWRAAQIAGAEGYIVVFTDRDTRDWERPGVQFMVDETLKNTDSGEGAIIMLHDSGGDRTQTVQALKEFIPILQAKGYRFTTLAEALELPRAEVPASVRSQAAGKLIVNSQRVAHFAVDVLGVLFLIGGALGLIRIFLLMVIAVRHARTTRRARKAPGMDDDPPSLTVIVPAFNEEIGIAATISSLRDTDFAGDLRIIVVDDGSTDRTAEIVRELADSKLTLITKDNGGKPSALNAGITHATSEIVVMVDGDTVFQRDTLRKIVRPFRDPRVGAVSGNAKVANRRGILGRWQHIEYVIGFNLDRRMFDVFDCMPTVPGAIGAFRLAALKKTGGVSEDTLAEDTDLTMAINRAGYRVAYEESAIAWTEAPASLSQLWRQRYRWCYGTMQAMWKHKSWFREKNGRLCLSYLTLFQVFFPLLAPAVDVFALHALLFGDRKQIAVIWLVFIGVQVLGGALALILDKEKLTPLWAVPLQQLVYRQLMYLIVIQSLATAVLGSRMRWQTIQRAGTFNEPGAVVPMVVTDTGPISVPMEFRKPKSEPDAAVKVAGTLNEPVAPAVPAPRAEPVASAEPKDDVVSAWAAELKGEPAAPAWSREPRDEPVASAWSAEATDEPVASAWSGEPKDEPVASAWSGDPDEPVASAWSSEPKDEPVASAWSGDPDEPVASAWSSEAKDEPVASAWSSEARDEPVASAWRADRAEPAPRDDDPTRTLLDATSAFPLPVPKDRPADPAPEEEPPPALTTAVDVPRPTSAADDPYPYATHLDDGPAARAWWEDDTPDEPEPADPRPWWEQDTPLPATPTVPTPEVATVADADPSDEDAEWTPLDPAASQTDVTVALSTTWLEDSSNPEDPVSEPLEGSDAASAASLTDPEPSDAPEEPDGFQPPEEPTDPEADPDGDQEPTDLTDSAEALESEDAETSPEDEPSPSGLLTSLEDEPEPSGLPEPEPSEKPEEPDGVDRPDEPVGTGPVRLPEPRRGSVVMAAARPTTTKPDPDNEPDHTS